MVRRYSGDRQRLPALRRGWRSVGGLVTVRKLLGYGRRALCAKLQFLPSQRRLVLADVQHHLSSRSCRSCCSPATTTTFFIIISISSSSRRASSREESAPLEWGGPGPGGKQGELASTSTSSRWRRTGMPSTRSQPTTYQVHLDHFRPQQLWF